MGGSSRQKDSQWIDRVAGQIWRWKLAVPAVFFLEMSRPFSFIASQGLFLCEPLMSFFHERTGVADCADLLADRSNVDCLIARLEQSLPQHGNSAREKGE